MFLLFGLVPTNYIKLLNVKLQNENGEVHLTDKGTF